MIKISVITSLFNCTKYLVGYFEAVEKIVNKEECEFLLLHNAPKADELQIITKEIIDKPWFRHIIIEEREGLYATWNRAVKLSKGIYCAVWNVDDVRFPDSLQLQANALDIYLECGLATGDINGTEKYGEAGNKLYRHESFKKNPKEAFRSCLVGCFPMWRKSIHNEIGYFDEQFKCVADFDFQIRVALNYKLYSVPVSLGIYLENDPNKISSNGLQVLENNIVYMRYGVYEKIVLTHLFKATRLYKKNIVINYGITNKFKIQKPFNSIYILKGTIVAIIMIPFYLAKTSKQTFFNIFK